MNPTAQLMYRFKRAFSEVRSHAASLALSLHCHWAAKIDIRYGIKSKHMFNGNFLLAWSKVTVSYSSVGGEQVEIWMPASLLDVGTQWHWAKVMSHIQTWKIRCAPDYSQMQVVLFDFVWGDLHRIRTLTSVEAEDWGAGWQAMRGTYYMVAQPVLSGSEPKPPRRVVTWTVRLIENHWFIFPGNTFSDLIQDIIFILFCFFI